MADTGKRGETSRSIQEVNNETHARQPSDEENRHAKEERASVCGPVGSSPP
jgi:hypothetical protein